ncbi:MAG: radical SAM protein [Desulfobacterales bacterium]|nr:radical SAM protein [Deltaproteobacteria bacterium]MBT8373365.1 radical SAM protein [Deltaproteobacteria bacterium]NNK84180.1 radical SAM protein [Desulfobacterales bacterium]NNL41222.1 radical SAM protein [Desulfobacterales bacterium]
MPAFTPAYIKAFKKGLLREKIKAASKILSFCRLCPRECGVDRISGETGVCNTGEKALVSSYNPHFGEEAPLVGTNGSGTIFFTHCNLLCLFCQNYDISHEGFGEEVTSEQLAKIMLDLQDVGCHNINFVTPSHVVPQILSAVLLAVKEGLNIPLVYNTGGYDSVETLKLLDDVFDIYMPDFKFWSSEISQAACQAKDYPEIARNALTEMHRQVGDLTCNENGIAERGLLIRHLVLPRGLAGTGDIMKFIATDISSNSYVNIMAQYRSCGRASEIEGLSTRLTPKEFETAYQAAIEEGITRLDKPKRVFVIN